MSISSNMVPLYLLLLVVILGGDFLHHGSTNGKYGGSFVFVNGDSIIADEESDKRSIDSGSNNDNQPQQQSILLRERRLNVPSKTSPMPTGSHYPSWSLSPYPSATPSAAKKPSSINIVPSSPIMNTPSSGSSPDGGGGSCFSSFNTVHVKDVGDIPISQLKIGDYIKTRNDQFTQVYGFGHYDHNMDEEFIQIICSSVGNSNNMAVPLEVTAQHLVFVERNNQRSSIPASDIVVGDYLNGNIVESIHIVRRRGVYAPLTQSGDLVVNGNIIVSNYINILQYNNAMLMNEQHALGHALFFPQRLLCKHFINTCKQETYINGYGYIAYIIVQIGSFINKNGGGWFTNIIVSLICRPLIALFTILG